MNAESEMFVKITNEFAHVRTRMKSVCKVLSEAFPTALIQDRMEFAQYKNSFSEPNVDRYVTQIYFDIAQGEGKSLCWWIDIECIENIWRIDASLRRDCESGEDSVWRGNYKAISMADVFSRISLIFDEIERFAKQKGLNFI